jgi:hypothetical protein
LKVSEFDAASPDLKVQSKNQPSDLSDIKFEVYKKHDMSNFFLSWKHLTHASFMLLLILLTSTNFYIANVERFSLVQIDFAPYNTQYGEGGIRTMSTLSSFASSRAHSTAFTGQLQPEGGSS